MEFVAYVLRLVQIRGGAFRKLMLGDDAEWGADEENRAQLLEIQAYQLELGWADRITDPNDPKVKREQAEARRRGIKPPPRPVVPPIARRPGDLAEQRLRDYIEELAAHQPKRVTERVSLTEFDKAMGLS